jgi:uncharacterized protein with GYD domain
MPQYLGRFSYTSDAVKVLIANPEDRSELGRRIFESVGGRLLGYWYCFGEFDGVFIAEAPDNASMTAAAMAVAGAGAIAKLETTVLIGMDEAQEAMRKAAAATYTAPTA